CATGQKGLNPPGGRGLLFYDNTFQETDRFAQAFFWREDGIFMLDRQHVIVAEHAQRGNESLPPAGVVTVAASAKDPGAILLVSVELGIEHARHRQVSVVDLRVLSVHVENRIAQNSDCRDWVD